MELSAAFTRSLLNGFEHAYTDLLRMAARSTGNREDARDLVHDTWLRLAEHARSGGLCGNAELPRDATAYLGVMAQHLALDMHRRAQRLNRHVDEAAEQALLAPSHVPDVADAVMYRQALQVLESTLAGLPERTRQVFVAHRVHGDRQPDIAARLGVSLNTVERDLIQAGDCIEDALRRWRGGTATNARRAGRRRSLGALLGLAGLGAGGSLAWHQWQAWRGSHVQWMAQWSSPRGRQTRHVLPDGSMLMLDALSRAEVRYFAQRRTVQLDQGAAFFEVARDPTRPFSVQAGSVRVVVLGTRFGVDITPLAGGGRRVGVQVESGRVRVEPAPGMAALELVAGDSVRVEAGDVQRSRAPADETASWRRGELVFEDATLGEALERLSRYTSVALAATPEAATLPLSGRVRIGQAGAWLEALPRVMPVRVRRHPAGAGWLVTRSG